MYSLGAGRLVGVITQNDATYKHPDIYLNFPRDRRILLIPSSPYLVEELPAVDANISLTSHRRHAYRYEVQIGASSDSALIGDRWSYREGRLCFGNWFNNKAFRWAFDGATIQLPTIAYYPHCIQFNIHATTDFEILIEDEVVASFPRSHDGSRWHNEDHRIELPAHLITSDLTKLQFRFIGASWQNIEFNLRQEGLALSRVIVDAFGEHRGDLPNRVARLAWSAPDVTSSGKSFPTFNEFIFARDSCSGTISQTAILISESEFLLLESYFSPHEQFWLTIRGVWTALLRQGVSASICSLARLDPAHGSDSVIVGPLRYDVTSTDAARRCLKDSNWAEGRRGIILSHSIPTLMLTGLPVGNEATDAFAYRELFEAPLMPDRGSNFWEMIITRPDYWAAHLIAIYENVLIGRPKCRPEILLATSSAEDWIETGDPDALFVLDVFCSSVSGGARLSSCGLPCAVSFREGQAFVAVYDRRQFADSGGSGIARGWPALHGPTNKLPLISGPIEVGNATDPSTSAFAREIAILTGVARDVILKLEGGISAAVLQIAVTTEHGA
ncbi:hypothetical protein [Methylobacterium sp. Leaf94]|uniref:hypothetical protein n=1 Tax=Methylobacterium sp. Leaf94 TaxID=1736250 RepID=UPI0012E39B75|nr:hypothetical protein [Methylobacterium sp. Leaf94]